MKTTLSLTIVLLLFLSCTDKKKEINNATDIEQNIEKIDSLKQTISEDIDELKNITEDVVDELKEIDNI